MMRMVIDAEVRPSEVWRFGLDFSRRVRTGVIISTITSVVVKNKAGEDVSSTILSIGSERIEDPPVSVSAEFSGFDHGEVYLAVFDVELSSGETRQGELEIPCLEYVVGG